MDGSGTDSAVLVTGAGKRVGLHLVRRLLSDGQPAIAHYHTPTADIAELQAAGVPVVQADLATPRGVSELVEKLGDLDIRLRGIVHNASAFAKTERSIERATEDFIRFFTIHMLAPYVLNESLRGMMATERCRADIVHICDIYAQRPNPDFDIYCATKAGLLCLTDSFAIRYAPDVKVNAILPGPILFGAGATDAYRGEVLRKTPLGEEGGPEAVYLALRSILENSYLTGARIAVDGGRHLTE